MLSLRGTPNGRGYVGREDMTATPHNSLRLVGSFPIAGRAGGASQKSQRGSGVLRPVASVRLTGTGLLDDSASAEAARSVAIENLSAARMSALDARWIVAVQVERALEGGKAAILPPEGRTRLMALAERVGLRPFDASLVIAVVQDAARAGEDPLGPLAVDRLRLVREGDASPLYTRRASRVPYVAAGLLIVAIAAGAAFLAARWLVG